MTHRGKNKIISPMKSRPRQAMVTDMGTFIRANMTQKKTNCSLK